MKKEIFSEGLYHAIRVILGFLFLFAAIHKIFEPSKFAVVIYNYRVLPVELLNLVAIIVPWIEILVGMALLIGVWVEAAALVLNSMTLFFIVLIISAIARGLNIECGCFSLDPEGSLVSWKRVLEDTLMLAGGVYLMIHQLRAQLRLQPK